MDNSVLLKMVNDDARALVLLSFQDDSGNPKFQFINRRFLELFQLTGCPEEYEGKYLSEISNDHISYLGKHIHLAQRSMEQNVSESFEQYFNHTQVKMHVNIKPYSPHLCLLTYISTPLIEFFSLTNTDIDNTAFKAGRCFFSPEGVILDANNVFKSMLHPKTAPQTINLLNFEHTELHNALEAVNSGKEYQFIGTVEGLFFNTQAVFHFYFNPPSSPMQKFASALIFDITSRVEHHSYLEQTNKRYHDVINFAARGILIGDANGYIIDANEHMTVLTGRPKQWLVGRHISNGLFTPESLKNNPMQFNRLLQGETVIMERDILRPDNSLITIEMHSKKMPDGTYQSIFHDISAKKKAEWELSNRNRELKTIFDNLPVGLVHLNSEGIIIRYNPAFLQILGATDKLVQQYNSIDTIKNSTMLQAVRKAQQGEAAVFEGEYTSVSGMKTSILNMYANPVKGESAPFEVLCILEDITERQKLRAYARKTEKLEALGHLAGGIAHDFNNLLSGIYGNISMALFAESTEESRELLNDTIKSIERAKALTQQLLTFSRGGAPVKKTGRIEPFIKDISSFVLSGSSCSYSIESENNLRSASFDENQMSQVLENILLNAVQSMTEGGKISIVCKNVHITKDQLPPLAEGDYIRLSITDTGEGMDAETASKIFDPFFTTRHNGTGLGLSTSYSIVVRHRGTITVESVQKSGSTFHIYLPALDNFEEIDEPKDQGIHRGSGTVFLMDDDEVVRKTTASMLSLFGYMTETAANGDDLLYKFALAKKDSVKAVILDLTVPGGTGGLEVARAIRTEGYELPVFLTSGYAEDPAIADPASYGFSDSLRKPFTVEDLSNMLNRHL